MSASSLRCSLLEEASDASCCSQRRLPWSGASAPSLHWFKQRFWALLSSCFNHWCISVSSLLSSIYRTVLQAQLNTCLTLLDLQSVEDKTCRDFLIRKQPREADGWNCQQQNLWKPSECIFQKQHQTTTISQKMIPKETSRIFLHSERTVEQSKSLEMYKSAKQAIGICSIALCVKSPYSQ